MGVVQGADSEILTNVRRWPEGFKRRGAQPRRYCAAYVSYRLPFLDDGSQLVEAKESRF